MAINAICSWTDPPIMSNTATTLLVRLFTRIWSVSVGNGGHSAKRPFAGSGIDVGQEGLARNLHSDSSQRYSVGLKRDASGVPQHKICLIVSCFVHGTVMLEQQTVATKLEAPNWLKCLCILLH